METKVEVVKENQLVTILKESQLDETKAAFILRNFQDYFKLADEWTIKARNIVVTSADQTAEMEMARAGRLFLRQKRLMIEGARKELKEQALREGKTIDGISNVLKGLIIPIEEYLENQEKFVERQEEAKREKMRLEIEARIEAERVTQERKEAEEREKLRLDNIKLKQEASRAQAQALAEKAKAEKVLAAERAKAQAERETAEETNRIEREAQELEIKKERMKADMEKKLLEEKARLEREKQEKTLANERAKAKRLAELAEEKAKAAQKVAMEKAVAERKEKERLAELLKAQVTCPKCGHVFNPKNGRK